MAMAENDDYLETIDNNHLDGTNGSLNMTDNSLGVSNSCFSLIQSIIMFVNKDVRTRFIINQKKEQLFWSEILHLLSINGNRPLRDWQS